MLHTKHIENECKKTIVVPNICTFSFKFQSPSVSCLMVDMSYILAHAYARGVCESDPSWSAPLQCKRWRNELFQHVHEQIKALHQCVMYILLYYLCVSTLPICYTILVKQSTVLHRDTLAQQQKIQSYFLIFQWIIFNHLKVFKPLVINY